MNERRFSGEIERLRSEERLARLEVPLVVDHTLDGLNANSVLDVGTGSAIFAEAFAVRGLTVKGIDVREDMLEAARSFVPDGEFSLGAMEQIPHPDQSVDLVFMGHVLHEADDLNAALAEARRVARTRVAILEWVYREEDFGPPLDHRLPADRVITAAQAAGYSSQAQIALTHMILYLLDV